MKTSTILLLFCVVISSVSSEDYKDEEDEKEEIYLRTGEACFIEYLKGKGKLDADFPSLLSPSTNCRLVMPKAVREFKNDIKSDFKSERPEQAECLYKEFESRNAVDDAMKYFVIELSEVLTEERKATEVKAAKEELDEILSEIARSCGADETKFIDDFYDL